MKQIKHSYNAGELSEYLAGRTDLAKYYNGCSKLINATVLPHGGVVKRSGTEYIATAPGKCHLKSFEFSTDDALILEFSDSLLRFYKNSAIVNGPQGTESDAVYAAAGTVVSHWKMNDNAANTVIDDAAGSHDGVASANTEDIHATGHVGTGCMNLDSQYAISFTDHADFTFIEGTNGDFSICGWVYINTTGSEQIIMSKWDETIGSQAREWKLLLDSNNKLKMCIADESLLLDSDLIAHWKLNDSASSATVTDATGNHNGTLSDGDNNYTSDHSVAGKVGNAFDFDGTNDKVKIDDDDALSFGDGSNDSPFSISAWINMDDATNFTIIGKNQSGANTSEWHFMVNADDKLTLRLFDSEETSYIGRVYDTAITAQEGSWIHVVATYDATEASSGITLYLNGSAVDDADNENGSYTSMHNTATDVYIGWEQYWNWYANGKIDNVMLFDKELSSAEVTALYNSNNGIEELNTVYPSRITDSALDTGWRFVAMTYEGEHASWTGSAAADYITLYVDGAAVDSTATNLSTYVKMEDTGAAPRIGAQESAAGVIEKIFNGKVDNFALFSDTLSASDVASLHTSDAYSIVSPYSSEEAFELHTTQSADVMYLAHENHHPQKLLRYGDTNWVIEDVPFIHGPFLAENTNEDYLIGFARTGGTARSGYYFPTGATGTLTATAHAPFNSDMVGALWLIKHARPDASTTTFAKDTNVTPTTTDFTDGAIRVKGDFTATFEPIATGKEARLWRKQGSGIWQEYKSFRGATSYSATEDEDDVYYAMTRSDNSINGTFIAKNQMNRGIVRITGFTSATEVSCTVIDDVLSDNTTDGAVTTSMWAEGAWSDYRGYPRTVCFHGDRLWWASTTNNPDTIWASKVSEYEDMETTDLGLDDEALTLPINDNEVSQIQWMIPRQILAVGGANREYKITASNPDDPITPTDRMAIPQTSLGSSAIQPVILNNAIFFFQRQSRKLRAMKYDAMSENFQADDVTILANTLLESAPVCMAVQRVPDSIIWVVRSDGALLSFTYNPDEEVAGWARHFSENGTHIETPSAYFESGAVIHGSTEDQVWVSVRRVVDSSTVRYIEKFGARYFAQASDALMLDSAVVVEPTYEAQDIGFVSYEPIWNEGDMDDGVWH